jgi:hypothetical protein
MYSFFIVLYLSHIAGFHSVLTRLVSCGSFSSIFLSSANTCSSNILPSSEYALWVMDLWRQDLNGCSFWLIPCKYCNLLSLGPLESCCTSASRGNGCFGAVRMLLLLLQKLLTYIFNELDQKTCLVTRISGLIIQHLFRVSDNLDLSWAPNPTKVKLNSQLHVVAWRKSVRLSIFHAEKTSILVEFLWLTRRGNYARAVNCVTNPHASIEQPLHACACNSAGAVTIASF